MSMKEVINMISSLAQDFEVIKAYIMALEKSKVECLKERWIDNQDVLQALHISKRKLQTLRDNGTLPFSRIHGSIYYKVSDLETLLEKHYSISKTASSKTASNGNE